MNVVTTPQTPEEILTQGEKIYFDHKANLEKASMGNFVAIEVESKEIFVDADKLVAIQKAQEKYPNKLFYIVQIGNLKKQSGFDLNEIRKYGWPV